MSKFLKRCYCNFCMNYVCEKECISEEKFIIPRKFNLEFDLKEKQVCRLAAIFLTRRNYIKITQSNPQVTLQDSLYLFMVQRRRIHKIFDAITCEAWTNIIERNGYASEKNLILKDFYISIQQLNGFREGSLLTKIIQIEKLLMIHL